MTLEVLLKLLGLFTVIGTGWGASRFGVFKTPEASRALSNAAFLIFGPALLFRSMAVMDFDASASRLLLTYYGTALLLMAGVRLWVRRSHDPLAQHAAAPAVRAVTAGFGNGVQVGIPMVSVLFGSAGLQLHLTLVSLHALVLLSACTVWAELDTAHAQARADGRRPDWGPLLLGTARNALIHPVVLPVLLGLGWNALGLGLPPLIDGTLQLLGQAMVPLCLVLIGVSLHEYGLGNAWRSALKVVGIKLLVLPALMLVVAWFGPGLRGLPLAVAVMYAALPTGANPLLFANRYGVLEAESSAVIVLSTAGYMLTAAFWLTLLGHLG